MCILICAPDRCNEQLARDLREQLDGVEVRIWPEIGNAEEVTFAILWKHPPDLLEQLPHLKAISSLGAGIEHLVNDPNARDLPIGRVVGPKLAQDLATWLVGQIIAHWRRFEFFRKQQAHQEWSPWNPSGQPTIGLLGMGAMGRQAAQVFGALNFEVLGYNTSGHAQEDIKMFSGQAGLIEMISLSNYLVCLLPLTSSTTGILNKQLMSHMPKDSVLINVGRGAHLVEEDLLDALAEGRPGHAILDVFTTEPLPKGHPFWTHPQISISPHCASLTDPREAAHWLADSYRRVMAGQSPLGLVDLTREY